MLPLFPRYIAKVENTKSLQAQYINKIMIEQSLSTTQNSSNVRSFVHETGITHANTYIPTGISIHMNYNAVAMWWQIFFKYFMHLSSQ